MAKHTPGPWTAHIENSGSDISISANSKRGNPIWVGRAYNSGVLAKPDPEREANAYLIAAAPELLKSLEQLLFFAHLCSPDEEDAVKFLEPAAAAIAKAKGA